MENQNNDNDKLDVTRPFPRQPEVEAGAVKPFTEHLEDLRGVLIRSLVALGVACAACLYFTDDIIKIFEWPLTSVAERIGSGAELRKTLLRSYHPTDALMVSFKVVIVTGLILASPYIFYQIWRFVRPGLKIHERHLAIPAFAAGVILFLTGVAFCYFLLLRFCLGFCWDYTLKMNVQPDWSIDNYISFVSFMMLAFGVVFEMPILAALLTKLQLINSRLFTGKRRYFYFGIAIVSALLTPSDFISMPMMIVVMIGLYEFSIFIIKWVENPRQTD
jgi:sec-independent protein translocase protein TatC